MSKRNQHHGHDHHHDHHGHHGHAPVAYSRAFALGVSLNLAFVVVEAAAGWISGSLALLADAGHNLSDVLSLLLAWGAAVLASWRPSKRRTYGLRRTTILASLLSALLLLIALGALVWEAIGRLGSPPVITSATMVAVAALGVVINTVSALLFRGGRHTDLNLRGAYLHLVADAAISCGVVVAGLVIWRTGWYWLDPATTMAIALAVLIATWSLLRESANLVLDAVPSGIDPDAVAGYLECQPGVRAVHDLHIWGLSTTESSLTAHLVMPEVPGDDFLARVSAELRDRFRIGHTTIQVERGDDCLQGRAGSL